MSSGSKTSEAFSRKIAFASPRHKNMKVRVGSIEIPDMSDDFSQDVSLLELSGASSLFNELNESFSRRSNTSGGEPKMGFGTELQGKGGHEALIKLVDDELRVMDILKRFMVQRVKCDRDYANALSQLTTTTNRTDLELTSSEISSLKVVKTLSKETMKLYTAVRRNADDLNNNLLEKLNALIKEKSDMKRQYLSERQRLDSEMKMLSDRVKSSHESYTKLLKSTKDSKLKYEEATSKGKQKDVDKSKEKFQKYCKRMNEMHNEYVIALCLAEKHQEHYVTDIIPGLLNALQETQESSLSQLKQVMTIYSVLTNTASEEFSTINQKIVDTITKIQPDSEYTSFIEDNKSKPLEKEEFLFDSGLIEEINNDLVANELVLNTWTVDNVKNMHSTIEEDLKKCQEKKEEKEKELENLEIEIKSIHPTEAQDTMIQEMLQKQKHYREYNKALSELRCTEEKLQCQFELIDKKLSEFGDDIPQVNDSLLDVSKTTGDDGEANSSGTSDSSKKSGKKGGTLGRMFKRNKKEKRQPTTSSGYEDTELPGPDSSVNSSSSTSAKAEKPLREQVWYHGAIPRQEAVELLKNEGEFLVRQKGDDADSFVLSVFWETKCRHFQIQTNQEGYYRLESDYFPSISQLIQDQLDLDKFVTKNSGAKLKVPIEKQWDLTHEDIELLDKLGKGNFGDVHKGRIIATNQMVAVKTCKENVDYAIRQKFLMEARILEKYDHPNIVKLIGVCTERHPLYIVMELVSGGDLISYLRGNDHVSLTDMVRMSENAAAGMAYLEGKKCIHRDLAARNCLVGEKKVVKISDFGMSREDEIYQQSGMKQIPIKWTAPEALNYGRYTSESDVWSYGILLWEIFSHGNTPYPGWNNQRAREEIERGHRMSPPDGTPPEIGEVMTQCWHYEPGDRAKFSDIHKSLKRLCKAMKA